MKRIPLSPPELAIIAGTRAALGAGLGLLLADRLNKDQRRAVGWTLLAVGVISTIPIAIELFRGHGESRAFQGSRPEEGARHPEAQEQRA